MVIKGEALRRYLQNERSEAGTLRGCRRRKSLPVTGFVYCWEKSRSCGIEVRAFYGANQDHKGDERT